MSRSLSLLFHVNTATDDIQNVARRWLCPLQASLATLPKHVAAADPWLPEVRMDGFQAIILICLSTVPLEQCNEQTASDILSIHVDNELGCTSGWQDVIARSSLYEDVGKTAYVRTICRRSKDVQ
jgi:hypothetical protein